MKTHVDGFRRAWCGVRRALRRSPRKRSDAREPLRLETLEDRTLLATAVWNGVGDWDANVSHWTPAPPAAGDDVVIYGAVTVSQNAHAVHNLVGGEVDVTGGSLSVAGSLTADVLNISDGSATVTGDSTVRDLTLAAVASTGGTLGVTGHLTVDGTMNWGVGLSPGPAQPASRAD
jgi:hypothetical protein